MEHILEGAERQHDWEEALAPKVSISDNKPVRKIICRYGRGCTHIYDPVHKERFWHPTCPALNVDQIRTHYICNECGVGFTVLNELQRHLQRKTAWSNNSLIGSRISCLVDSKEWHEGIVTQFHPKSGKHYVEFRAIGEKRWLGMSKMAFYIIERPQEMNACEVKEMDQGDPEYNPQASGTDDTWTVVEDISLDYAFAQSVLFKIYGSVIQETGHKTRGHICLTPDDRDNVKTTKGSLLYGELLPRGANRAFDTAHLSCGTASVLFDLGCGTGKVVIQAFLQYRNLQYVCGVEISLGRYSAAEEAVLHMVELLGEDGYTVELRRGQSIVVRERIAEGEDGYCYSPGGSSAPVWGRTLRIECGNMMDVKDLHTADIVMLETDIPLELQSQLCNLLQNMPEGSRTLTYLDLRKIWDQGNFPFKQHEANRSLTDRFPTSWSVQRGHHFYIWHKMQRVSPGNSIRQSTGNWPPSMSPHRSQSLINDNEDGVQSGSIRGTGRHPTGTPGDHDGCLPFLFMSSWKSGRQTPVEAAQLQSGGYHQPSPLPAVTGRADSFVRTSNPPEQVSLPPIARVPSRKENSVGSSYADDDASGSGRVGVGNGSRSPSIISNNRPSSPGAGGHSIMDDSVQAASPPTSANTRARRPSPRTIQVSPRSPEIDRCADSPERTYGRERRREVRNNRRQPLIVPVMEKVVSSSDQGYPGQCASASRESASGRTSPPPLSDTSTSKSTCVIS